MALFGSKYVWLTRAGEQLAESIIKAGCSPLPICQSAIIGLSVLYVHNGARRLSLREQNGRYLPLDRGWWGLVSNHAVKTCSAGNPQDNFLHFIQLAE